MNDENDIRTLYFIETDFYVNTMHINLKRYLLNHIDNFKQKGHLFSHIDEKNISTINDKMFMTYDIFIKHPMQAIDLKSNKIVAKNPHLINSLNKSLSKIFSHC